MEASLRMQTEMRTIRWVRGREWNVSRVCRAIPRQWQTSKGESLLRQARLSV